MFTRGEVFDRRAKSSASPSRPVWVWGLCWTYRVGLMTDTFEPNVPIIEFDVPGKTTAQMTDPNTFIKAGWDFEGTWSQLYEQDYPSLAWEHIQCE